MNKRMPLLHPMYGELLLHSAESLGLDTANEGLQRCVDSWQQSKNPCDFVRLLTKLTELISVGPTTLAFCFGENLHPSCAGSVGLAMISAPNLGSVLEVVGRYYSLTGLAMSHNMSTVDGKMLVNFDIDYAGLTTRVRIFFIEVLLACWQQGAHFLTATKIRCDRICLDYDKPDDFQYYSDYFGCPVEFGCNETGVFFSPQLLHQPIVSANPIAYKRSLNICEKALYEYRARLDYADRVRRCMPISADMGSVSLESVAEQLNISPRTLGRYLQTEGTGFQRILEEQRREKACELLSTTSESLEIIAERIGYSDISNFRRAFIRWVGVAPAVYRKRNRYLLSD